MPDIEYAFLADAADARPGQKFAVIGGGVSRLGGPNFPLRHPHLALVCGLTVTAPEFGAEHDLQFVLLTPDGKQLSTATAKILASGPTDGRDSVLTFSLDLRNLSFQAGRGSGRGNGRRPRAARAVDAKRTATVATPGAE